MIFSIVISLVQRGNLKSIAELTDKVVEAVNPGSFQVSSMVQDTTHDQPRAVKKGKN